MEYLKKHLSLEQQADLLLSRGLIADRNALISRLSHVGYYRFSAYTHPYRKRDAQGRALDQFVNGSHLDDVWFHYCFDRKLRLHLLDAIERIEICLRSAVAYFHSECHGPFEYTKPTYFPHWKNYDQQLKSVRIKKRPDGSLMTSGNDYVDHFFSHYGDKHEYLPLWMAVGTMEFGTVLFFYLHSPKDIKRSVADRFAVDSKYLGSWLQALKGLRNECAHHGRIWNKTFARTPQLPHHGVDIRWHMVYSEKARKWVKPCKELLTSPSLTSFPGSVAQLIFICRILMRQAAPTSGWKNRIEQFLLEAGQSGINYGKMGLPQHWERHPLWL